MDIKKLYSLCCFAEDDGRLDLNNWGICGKCHEATIFIEEDKLCDECGVYPKDYPSNLCTGCNDYKEHQWT